MPFSMSNLIATGTRSQGGQSDALDAAVGTSSRMWNGFQPFGWLVGRYDGQGTIGGRWVVADWKVTAQGGAGTSLAVSSTQPSLASFITRATADGDGYNMQWTKDGGTTVVPAFIPTAGLNIYCEGRFKVDNAADDAHTKSRFYFGIGDADTAIHGSVSKFIGLYKASGAATMVGVIDDTGQTLTTGTGAITNDTYFTCGFRVNGVSSVDFFVNGVLIERQTTVSNLPTAAMALSFEGQTSEAAAITYTLQHLVAFQEAY